jgi:hypothetical protein
MYYQEVPDAFDFSTSEILAWELERIHQALLRKQIRIEPHAVTEADNDNIPLVKILEAILVGIPISKDLPNNILNRVPGINFEHRHETKWFRVKVAFIGQYAVITVHKI